MRSGWVKIHRKIYEHPRSNDPEYMAIWLWMLCEASYENRKVLWKGMEITLKPGQFTAGRLQISSISGVNPSKVQRVINWMKNDQQIDQQTGNKYSIFTILKWEQYQLTDQQDDQQSISRRSATDQLSITPEEVNNTRTKEYKNNTPPTPLKGEAPIGAAAGKKKPNTQGFEENWPEIRKHKDGQSKSKALEAWARCIKFGLTPEQIITWQRTRLGLRPIEEHKFIQAFQFAAKPDDIKDGLENEGKASEKKQTESVMFQEAIRIAEENKLKRIRERGALKA